MEPQPRMEPRLDYSQAAPGAARALMQLEQYVRSTDLEPALLALVKTRASQLNGCAFCIDMHTKEARRRGEAEERLFALSAWRETPFFSRRERAALAWTETITRIGDTQAPDEVYEAARRHFSEEELVNLTLAIATVNAWNRMAVGFRLVPGSFAEEGT